MPYLTTAQLDSLKDVLHAARMETASFHDPMSEPLSRDWWNNENYTAQVREATRLFRETWIIGPLEEIIKHLEQKG